MEGKIEWPNLARQVFILTTFSISPQKMSQYLFVRARNSASTFSATLYDDTLRVKLIKSPAAQLSPQILGILRKWLLWQPKGFRWNTQGSSYIRDNLRAIPRNKLSAALFSEETFKILSPSCIFSTLQWNILCFPQFPKSRHYKYHDDFSNVLINREWKAQEEESRDPRAWSQ